MSNTTEFRVTSWPSLDELLDAFKYANDLKRRFRVSFTIRSHSSNGPVLIDEVEVLGVTRFDGGGRSSGIVRVKARLHIRVKIGDVAYRNAIAYFHVPTRNRREDGWVELDPLPY